MPPSVSRWFLGGLFHSFPSRRSEASASDTARTRALLLALLVLVRLHPLAPREQVRLRYHTVPVEDAVHHSRDRLGACVSITRPACRRETASASPAGVPALPRGRYRPGQQPSPPVAVHREPAVPLTRGPEWVCRTRSWCPTPTGT